MEEKHNHSQRRAGPRGTASENDCEKRWRGGRPPARCLSGNGRIVGSRASARSCRFSTGISSSFSSPSLGTAPGSRRHESPSGTDCYSTKKVTSRHSFSLRPARATMPLCASSRSNPAATATVSTSSPAGCDSLLMRASARTGRVAAGRARVEHPRYQRRIDFP